jgi:putative transposase
VSRRKGVRTTVRCPESRPAPDLVERDFAASGPDRLWVADITYVASWAGFLYLSVVLDAWSREVIGWAMATHLRTQLALDALEMALCQGGRGRSSITPTRARSTPPSPSGSAVGRPESVPRWVRSVTLMTTLCARASSRHSSASCSIAAGFARKRRLGWRSSSSSRASTTRNAGTRLSVTSPRSTTRGRLKLPSDRFASRKDLREQK